MSLPFATEPVEDVGPGDLLDKDTFAVEGLLSFCRMLNRMTALAPVPNVTAEPVAPMSASAFVQVVPLAKYSKRVRASAIILLYKN